MKAKSKQSGLTLMEMTLVIAVVALLTILGLPAIRTFFNSFELSGGTKSMISAALASGRAIAASRQHYAGIRFQKRYQEDNKGCQYMIFIINDTEIGPGKAGNLGCRAVKGIEPIKLPDSVGVMDLRKNYNEEVRDVISKADFNDTTTFSILFSPSGKLVIHELWVRNRDDSTASKDDIFNTKSNVQNGIGMFLQDESSGDRRREPSRNSFIIYDKTRFDEVDKNRRYSDYLEDLEVIYINPYTGTMIK